MSFRGRYPTRFRRSGGFKKSFSNDKEFTFKRRFQEERGSSFKRPRGNFSFRRNEPNLVYHQADYDRGRGQWNPRRSRGRNLRSPRSRFMRGRYSHHESRGTRGRQFDARQHHERPASPDWFEEEDEFDSDRHLFDQRSPRIDFDKEEGFDQAFHRRSRSPLIIIKRTFGEDSPERYSRERSFERRSGSPVTSEHFEDRNLNERRSRSCSYRSRSLERNEFEMRDRISFEGRSSPPFMGDSRNYQGGGHEGSFDERYSGDIDQGYFHDRESRHIGVERNSYLRSPGRLYNRRSPSPHSTSSKRFQKHHFSESGETSRRRDDFCHSSVRNFKVRNTPSQGNNLVQSYDSPRNRRGSPEMRNLSEERIVNSPRFESSVGRNFEREGSPFDISYHERHSSVFERTSPRSEFSNDRDEIISKSSFLHENLRDRNLRRNDTGYFVERQRMKRVYSDERKRGHEKRSESSIERFLNDCKKSVERRPGSSRFSSPRDTNREYDFENQQYRLHSSQRKFHGPDQIVIDRGRSFERSLSPNDNNSYQSPKNVLGSPTEWGNVKKQIVSLVKESSTANLVPDQKQADGLDDELFKDMSQLQNTKRTDSSQQLSHSKNTEPNEIIKEKILTDSDSGLNHENRKEANSGDLTLSSISQSENLEPKEISQIQEPGNRFDLSPISQSSLGFKDSPIKSAQTNDANMELSPISLHENFEQPETVDHNLDLSPISQPGSFEKREFSQETDNLSGLSSISQNSLAREKENSNDKKISKSSESCDSMQEFLKELERSCERSRSESECSLEYQIKTSGKNTETKKSTGQRKSIEPKQSMSTWKRQLEPQNTKQPTQYKSQNTTKYASKITYTYPVTPQLNKGPNPIRNVKTEMSTSFNESNFQAQDVTKNNSFKTLNRTDDLGSRQFSTMNSHNYPHSQTFNYMDIPDQNQNQLETYNLSSHNQASSMHDHGSVNFSNNTLDFPRKPKENPSQNQHVLQVLGPTKGSVSGQTVLLPIQNPPCVGMQNFNQPFKQFPVNTNATSNQISDLSMPPNQNAMYSQNIPVSAGQNAFVQNEFVNVPVQVGHWNLSNQNVPFASEGSTMNFNPTMNFTQSHNSSLGLPLNIPVGFGSNPNQFSSEIKNLNPTQFSQYSNNHVMNQTIPDSQNLAAVNFVQPPSESHVGPLNSNLGNRPAVLKNKPLKAATVVDIKKCLTGTFGHNYLLFLNPGVQEVISLSDDEGPEESNCYGIQSQEPISLNPSFLEQYKNNPPSAEEMAKMLDGFVIFFDAKSNSELEKDPFVVIHESFAKSNKFGNLQAEETNLYVDFLPVPKKVCVLRWQGLMLARGEGYTLEEARRKAGISLINALAQHFYTVQTKYSYYCGGKLPKFMIKTKQQPGVYKVVDRDEIIKAVTEVLKELKQKGAFTGRGVDATSIKVVLDFIDNFFKDKNNFYELLFGGKGPMDYTLEDLKQISNHVKRLSWLQWRTIGGYGRGSFTAVSRVFTPQQLCSYLLASGGETVRYKLLPPQGPWIELLTADAQYHPAIIKNISNKPDAPQEWGRRNNKTIGGFGTGWGKRGTWM